MTSAPPTPRDVRVAVLGCGNVGAALVGHPPGPGRRARRPDRGPPRASPASPSATSDADRAAHVPRDLLTADAAGAGGRPVGRRGGRAHRRHRAGRGPGAGGPRRRASRWSPPTRRCWPRPTGVALRTLARERGVDLLYEAAVAGAIPLVRALRESLTGERIHRVMGIVNGTTNFILTRMGEQGADYADVLAEAQALGLAERDPTADVEGFDAAAKAAILAGVAFGYDVSGRRRAARGDHRRSAPIDVDFADRLGYVDQAAGRRRARPATDGLLGAGPPGAGARRPPAGRGARRLQRRVHRGRGGRRADALRPGRRRAAHGQCGGRRPDRRRPQPAGRHHGPGPRPPAGPPGARGRARSRLLHQPRRGRPARRARPR